VEGENRVVYSVMPTSIPSSISTGSSKSVGWSLFPGINEEEAVTLDEPGTPMSGQESLEEDKMVTGGEKPKGGKTGGANLCFLGSSPRWDG